jgi:hypothetical protein
MSNHVVGERAAAGRTWVTRFRALIVVVGLAIVGVVLAVRLANKAPSPTGQDGWLIAWLVVGLVDAVAGATLVTRLGYRRLAACLLVVGLAAVLVVVMATGSDVVTSGRRGLVSLPDTGSWARPLATGVLVALVPWELTMSGRNRWHEVVWWATAALVVATTVGAGLDMRGPGLDVFDVAMWRRSASSWRGAVHAASPTIRCSGGWWRARSSPGSLSSPSGSTSPRGSSRPMT